MTIPPVSVKLRRHPRWSDRKIICCPPSRTDDKSSVSKTLKSPKGPIIHSQTPRRHGKSRGDLVGWIRRTLAGIWGSKEPLHLSVAIENHETEPPETIDPPTVRQRPPVSAKSPVAQLMGTIKKGLTEIPPLPHVIRELLRELSDPASTARSVARIATSDPTLAAALLRTVNSAAMGLRRRINSVPEAISFLGYTAVRSLVIRMRLEQVLPTRKGQAAYDQDDLWIHSLAVAHAADCLAEQVAGKIPHVDRGFVANHSIPRSFSI